VARPAVVVVAAGREDGSVLTSATARRLRDAGLTWSPASGDRFVIADRGMDEDVFVVSEMVVEHFRGAAGPLLRFHGTTEWALDYVLVSQVLWLPREDQLRSRLGAEFVALAQVDGEWVVTTADGRAHRASDAEEAYAAAWLATA
jgi:hypothetical protein